MLHRFLALLLAGLLVIAMQRSTAAPPALRTFDRAQSSNPPLGVLYDSVAKVLADGNAVVFVVPYASTDPDQTDQPNWWKECALTVSEQGQRQAQSINRGLRRLAAPVGIVASSDACISMTTATFTTINLSLKIHPTSDLNPVEIQRMRGISDAIIRARLESHFNIRWPNTTTVISGHSQTTSTALHPAITDMAPGETAIFSMSPQGELTLAARLNWRQWEEMTNYIVSKKRQKRLHATK